MIGRADERALIAGLLADARAGRSGMMVLSGEPGVGKSVLLAEAEQLAAGMRVLRAAGVETEVDLVFAGLHQLVRPVLGLLDRLPAPHAQALLGALGLSDHHSEDRFLVAAATLSLLAEAAEDGPVLCVLEDAHWLDAPSAEALAFAARRLDAEGVVVLVATRSEPWPGLPERRVGGLGPEDGAALLREHAGDVVPEVGARLVAETGGNALALVELAAVLTPAQLAGQEALPVPLRLPGRVQEAFGGRVRRLQEASQALLLVAAADDTGDPAVVLRAAELLGVGADALEAAERAGLASVDCDGRIAFRHPLVRAAVYQSATFTARAAAHRALVQALDGEDHVYRRAWHLAAAATHPDQSIARELEHSAEVARQRGGHAVASAAFKRAADLSPARADRARLVLAAARSAFQAGQADRASGLADRAGSLVNDPVTADEVALLRGRIAFARGSAVTAHTLLLTGARGLSERDPRAAATALVEAARAAWNIHDPGRMAETTELLGGLRLPAGDPLDPLVSASLGAGDLIAGRIAQAIERMRSGTDAMLRLVSSGRDAGDDARFVEASLARAGFTRVTGDDAAGLALGAWVVAECRTRRPGQLAWALGNLAMTEALAGRHSAALVSATEGLRLARDLGQPTAICSCESILAWLAAVRGEEDRCRELANHAVELGETYQLPAISVIATWALGLLDLSLGRPEQALARLLDPTRGPLAVSTAQCLFVPDLVEAAARARQTHDLGRFVGWYEDWAACTGQPWAEAAAHRCQALLAGHAAEAHFQQALRLHQQTGPDHRPFDRARTQLLYGQWLRRTRRRADARIQLAAAGETFQRLGASPWADRAGAELRATGQTLRRSNPDPTRLTPQELQVVQLVAAGGSNQDVAAQLFLSPRTVAYHLYKAFPKLGVASRADLARLDLDALIVAS